MSRIIFRFLEVFFAGGIGTSEMMQLDGAVEWSIRSGQKKKGNGKKDSLKLLYARRKSKKGIDNQNIREYNGSNNEKGIDRVK